MNIFLKIFYLCINSDLAHDNLLALSGKCHHSSLIFSWLDDITYLVH